LKRFLQGQFHNQVPESTKTN